MGRKDSIIQEMISIQKHSETSCLTETDLKLLADDFQVSKLSLIDTASFYRGLSLKPRGKTIIGICSSPACLFSGKEEILEAVKDLLGIDIGETTADGRYTLETLGCLGACDVAPTMLLNGRVYGNLTVSRVRELLVGEETESRYRSWGENIKPEEENGYPYNWESLRQAVAKPAYSVIQEIERAGLRGRGGAFFPTALKWKTFAAAEGKEKYIVCNADEGEPGTFKDRYILDYFPWKVIEGMLIAACVAGASKGYIYLRGEYGELYEKLCYVLSEMEGQKLFSEAFLGAERTFSIEIRLGAGAYVCGEETALLESLEDKRGQVRNKPTVPALKGLHGMPTLVDNVETFLCAAEIAKKGADSYTDMKFVCVSGCVNHPGVYRIPFGMPVLEIITNLAGGIREGSRMKFLHLGGLTGCCIDAQEVEGLLYGIEELKEKGLSIGTGAIFVGAEDVDYMEYMTCAVEFFCNESCGKCTPCREGLHHLRSELRQMEQESEEERQERCSRVFRILDTMEIMSNCGLGQAVPKFMRSILNLYEKERAKDGTDQ